MGLSLRKWGEGEWGGEAGGVRIGEHSGGWFTAVQGNTKRTTGHGEGRRNFKSVIPNGCFSYSLGEFNTSRFPFK